MVVICGGSHQRISELCYMSVSNLWLCQQREYVAGV